MLHRISYSTSNFSVVNKTVVSFPSIVLYNCIFYTLSVSVLGTHQGFSAIYACEMYPSQPCETGKKVMDNMKLSHTLCLVMSLPGSVILDKLSLSTTYYHTKVEEFGFAESENIFQFITLLHSKSRAYYKVTYLCDSIHCVFINYI